MFDSGDVINQTRCQDAIIQHHRSPGNTSTVSLNGEREKGSMDGLDPSCNNVLCLHGSERAVKLPDVVNPAGAQQNNMTGVYSQADQLQVHAV